MTPEELPTEIDTFIETRDADDAYMQWRLIAPDKWCEWDSGDVLHTQDLVDQFTSFHVLAAPQFSGRTVNGHRLSWRELAGQQQDEIRKLSKFATMVSDLDRNEHGRHQGDSDGFGVSEGNPHVRPGEVLGYSIHGTHEYRMPERGRRHDADAWTVRVESVS